MLFGLPVDVEGQLFLELLLDAAWDEQRADAQCEIAKRHIIESWCRLSTLIAIVSPVNRCSLVTGQLNQKGLDFYDRLVDD